MFVNSPDQFILPSYRISPFKTDFISLNLNLTNDDFVTDYFNNRFGIGNYFFTTNGREGIDIVLRSYDLKKDDLVTILTTTQNVYISSCVTQSIEKYCRWNREILPETKIVFVNHEFGFPYKEMHKLAALGLPIIEDCCTTFFSQDMHQKIGKYGDFSIYSFPKFFPIQIGGLVVTNNSLHKRNSKLTEKELRYIQNVLSYHLKNEKDLLELRTSNYSYMLKVFASYGFKERILKDESVYPTSFLFNTNKLINNLPKLKEYLYQHGIQCSVFYGEDAFFVPCHQNMNHTDIDYIINCIIEYKNNN